LMIVALWCSLVIPSLFVVQKYAGGAGVALYLIGAAAAVLLIPRVPLPHSPGARAALAFGTVAVLLMIFVAVYPTANSQQPGFGSDDDDAYNVGVEALLAGHSPYASTTYLGNVLHQFTGAFVLASPFVLLGTSAWQNLFWLPLFFIVLSREAKDGGAVLRIAWLVLLASPVVLHQVVTGTGHVANAVYVLLGMWWVVRGPGAVVPAVAWGVALASRANFLFLIPLAFGWNYRTRGPAAAVCSSLLTLLVAGLLIVPFYLHDPTHFGPLEAADRLRRVNEWVPSGGEAIAAIMAVLAVALGCTRMDRRRLLLHCAAVQSVPILLVSGVSVLATGVIDLSYATYAVFVLPFVVAAAALPAERHDRGPATALETVSVSKGSQAATPG
jgi:hypothetical protein